MPTRTTSSQPPPPSSPPLPPSRVKRSHEGSEEHSEGAFDENVPPPPRKKRLRSDRPRTRGRGERPPRYITEEEAARTLGSPPPYQPRATPRHGSVSGDTRALLERMRSERVRLRNEVQMLQQCDRHAHPDAALVQSRHEELLRELGVVSNKILGCENELRDAVSGPADSRRN